MRGAIAWGWLLSAALAVAARSAHATDDELTASEAVLDASQPEAPSTAPAADDDHEDAFFEIAWTTFLTASGGEPETNLELDADGWRVEDLLRPRQDKLYPSTSVAMYGEVPATDWLLFRGLLDTREIRAGSTLEPPLEGVTMGGNPAVSELRSGNVIRELSVMFGHDVITAELGRFRAAVADGLVYKDFGTGVRVRADFEAMELFPLQAELLLTTVGQQFQDFESNGVLQLRVDWMRSPFEFIGWFLALSEDKNGEISEAVRSAYAETLISDPQKLDSLFLQEQGSGGLLYTGAQAQLIVARGMLLRARTSVALGTLKLAVPLEEIETPAQVLEGRPIEVRIAGFAADAELRYGLTDHWELRGFALLLSGDGPPDPQDDHYRYNSFIALAPYWVWSGLFFSGGLTQGLYPTRASAAGVNGRGVIGGGPAIEYKQGIFRGEFRAALLASTTDPPAPPLGGRSRLYGAELDLIAGVQALAFLDVAAEIDVLFPGGFFPRQRVAYLALLMMTVSNAE